jgi:hypothetical protein
MEAVQCGFCGKWLEQPPKWVLWWTGLLSLRDFFAGILLGLGVGLVLGPFLAKKLGWKPDDYKAYLLGLLLMFGSTIMLNLRRTKTK